MSDETEVPSIESLTVRQMNLLVCADYLETIAKLIRKGSVTSLEFLWNSEIEKPVGKIVIDAGLLIGPTELKISRAITEYKSEQDKKISVEDLTSEAEEDPEAKDITNDVNFS